MPDQWNITSNTLYKKIIDRAENTRFDRRLDNKQEKENIDLRFYHDRNGQLMDRVTELTPSRIQESYYG